MVTRVPLRYATGRPFARKATGDHGENTGHAPCTAHERLASVAQDYRRPAFGLRCIAADKRWISLQ
jgi:hypothetical protein